MAISVLPVPNAPLMTVSRGLGIAGTPRSLRPGLHAVVRTAAASAIELNFVSSESAREVRTTGALAPTMTAASGHVFTRPRIL